MTAEIAKRGFFSHENTRWPTQIGFGVVIAVFAVAVQRFGLVTAVADAVRGSTEWLTDEIGIVWIPLMVVEARILQLAVRAIRSRFDMGVAHVAVSTELGLWAIVCVNLGFFGTVLGMSSGFAALGDADFLAKLPELLHGTGNAMASTLMGLAFAIEAHLLAALFPTWSWARIESADDSYRVSFDGRVLGCDSQGLEILLQALRTRQPAAVCVAFDPALSDVTRSTISNEIWANHDADHKLSEVILS